MAKVALLIGVSEYEPGLNPLPAAAKDVEAMQRVLRHPEIGSFDQVILLINPERQAMEEAIYALFASRTKEDLLLLFFSGHGIKDDSGNLFLATTKTRKDQGKLVQPTAVAASVVQDMMNRSRSKRQVVILDCCFSGAFAEGMKAKDDGSVPIKQQLGGEGRAVLTSSTSTQYSFEQQGSELSTYTRYLVEGIETGVADSDGDGAVSVDELHEYAKKKVQEAAPAQQPEIYPIKEGHKILLAKAPIGDPKLRYRKEVERFAKRGEISSIGRTTLDLLRDKLGLLPDEATAIEAEILEPYREYRKRLELYKQHFSGAIARENPISLNTRRDLEDLQEALGLRDEDIEPIRAEVVQKAQKSLPSSPKPSVISPIPANPDEVSTKNVGTGSVSSPRRSPILTGCGLTMMIGTVIITIGTSIFFVNTVNLVPNSDSTHSPDEPATVGSCIINSGELNVRSKPEGNIFTTLKPKQQLSTTGKEQDGWIEISTPVRGWVFKDYTQPCSSSKGTAPLTIEMPQVIPTTSTPTKKKSVVVPTNVMQTPKIPKIESTIELPNSPSIPEGFGKIPDNFGKAPKSWCISVKQGWEFDKQHPEIRLNSDEYYQMLLKEKGCE